MNAVVLIFGCVHFSNHKGLHWAEALGQMVVVMFHHLAVTVPTVGKDICATK